MYCSTTTYKVELTRYMADQSFSSDIVNQAYSLYSEASDIMSDVGLYMAGPGSFGEDCHNIPDALYNSHNGSEGWNEVLSSKNTIDDYDTMSDVIKHVCGILQQVCQIFGFMSQEKYDEPYNWEYITSTYPNLALFVGWVVD